MWYAIQASLGNEASGGQRHENAPIDDFLNIDENAVSFHSDAHNDDVPFNVSMDDENASTPKKRNMAGPIFEATEFGPAGKGPQVQESAFVQQINQQKKQMSRAEHAQQIREKRRAQFEDKQSLARSKMAAATHQVNGKGSLRGQLG